MKAIIEYFKKCPALSGCSVRQDFLGPESGNIAIAPDGGDHTEKVYASGDMLGGISFKIMVRENFTGKANGLLDAVSDWIDEEAEELPTLGGGKLAQYIEVVEGPVLVKTDVNAGIYEMKLRLIYYRKGEKNE